MGVPPVKTYRNDAVFGLDELVESFTQLGLHVAPQAAKGEAMRLAGLLSDRRVMSALCGAKRYSAVHGGNRFCSLERRLLRMVMAVW